VSDGATGTARTNRAGSPAQHRAQCDPHCRSDSDAVIDDNHSTPGDFDWRSAGTVGIATPFDLLQLLLRLGFDVVLRDVEAGRELPVNKGVRSNAIGDCAEGELGLPRHADLANEHDIERRIERLGNLKTDGDAAARQGQDHRLPVRQMCQLAGKAASGITAICVFHRVASLKILRS
jgi:hypothetical protein